MNIVYKGNTFRIIKYIPVTVTVKVFTISMSEFKAHYDYYFSQILTGAKVYTLGFNNGDYEIQKP